MIIYKWGNYFDQTNKYNFNLQWVEQLDYFNKFGTKSLTDASTHMHTQTYINSNLIHPDSFFLLGMPVHLMKKQIIKFRKKLF